MDMGMKRGLEPQEVQELIEAYLTSRDSALREQLIEGLDYVVYVIVRVHVRTSLSHDDFMQIGREGLVRAVRDYDPDKGYFLSYARRRVLGSVQSGLRDIAYGNRQTFVPSYHARMIPTLMTARRRLSNSMARQPLPWEVYEEVCRIAQEREQPAPPLYQVGSALGVTHETILRLDGPTDAPELNVPDRLGHEIVADTRSIGSDDLVRARRRLDALMRVIEHVQRTAEAALSKRSLKVWLARTPFDGSDGRTHTEIGLELGVTESRSCQMEAQAWKEITTLTGFSKRDVLIMLRMREDLLAILVPRS